MTSIREANIHIAEKAHSWLVFYLLVAIVIAIFSFLTWRLISLESSISNTSFGPYNNYQCSTGNSQSQRTFYVRNMAFYTSIEIADSLCQNSKIKNNYGFVNIFWSRRKDLIEDTYRNNQVPDLIVFSRGYLVEMITATVKRSYIPIAHAPTAPVGVYFWSHNSSLSMTRDFFLGKTIGLINEPHSQSRYSMPLAMLHQTGLLKQDFNIKLFESDYALRQALHDNKVDAVASFSTAFKPDSVKGIYIGDAQTFMSYLSTDLVEASFVCDIATLLNNVFTAQNAENKYRVEAFNFPCPESDHP